MALWFCTLLRLQDEGGSADAAHLKGCTCSGFLVDFDCPGLSHLLEKENTVPAGYLYFVRCVEVIGSLLSLPWPFHFPWLSLLPRYDISEKAKNYSDSLKNNNTACLVLSGRRMSGWNTECLGQLRYPTRDNADPCTLAQHQEWTVM